MTTIRIYLLLTVSVIAFLLSCESNDGNEVIVTLGNPEYRSNQDASILKTQFTYFPNGKIRKEIGVGTKQQRGL